MGVLEIPVYCGRAKKSTAILFGRQEIYPECACYRVYGMGGDLSVESCD